MKEQLLPGERISACDLQRKPHRWRVTRCKDDIDELTCARCGAKKEAPCNFDEESS